MPVLVTAEKYYLTKNMYLLKKTKIKVYQLQRLWLQFAMEFSSIETMQSTISA